MTIRSSVISDLDFILHLWLQMKYTIDTLSYKEGATRCSLGNVTAVRNMI